VNSNLSAIVLAGGKSSRMGRDKSQLDFGGDSILGRIVRELRLVSADIVIVAGPQGSPAPIEPIPDVRIVHDARAFEGPLKALARGLDAIEGELAFACSCDLPLLDARVVAALCKMAGGYDAVVPEVGGLLQPLHAVYRKACAQAVAEMTARGQTRMVDIVDALSVRIVPESELRPLDPELLSFTNVNTPDEYRNALRLMSSR
jgi:molybdopterin-guanine dinucleotide biosynthesis protein A